MLFASTGRAVPAAAPLRACSPTPRRFHIRLFGAGFGRPQCGFHISAPAFSPRKALQGQCGCVKAHKSHESAPTQPRRSVKRVQRGGSAASTFDSLAQSGAAAVRLPHLAPAYSPRKNSQCQCARAKAHKGHEHAPAQPRRSVKRVQRVEDSLAQSGAAAVRLPHLAPAFSPRKELQGQCARAKAYKGREHILA